MRSTSSLVVVLAVSAAVAGTASAGERFQRHAVPGEGVSLEVPASWIAVDSREATTTDIVEKLSRRNPAFGVILGGLTQPALPMRFVAFDPVVRRDGFTTNVTVSVMPVPGTMTFAQQRRELVAVAQALAGAGKVEQAVVRVGGVRALRLRYRLSPRHFQTYQCGFLRKNRRVLVAYTTATRHASRYAATFTASAASIRFTR